MTWYSPRNMRSPAFRLTIGAAAWIAIGVAAPLLVRSEQRINSVADGARAFDLQARDAIDAFAEARMGQQAYVAAGQGIGFWMPKVTASAERAGAALTAMRSSASPPALAAIETLLRRAPPLQQFLDPRPEAACQIFDARDRRGRQHTVGMRHLGYGHRAPTLTEELRPRHALPLTNEPQRRRDTEKTAWPQFERTR